MLAYFGVFSLRFFADLTIIFQTIDVGCFHFSYNGNDKRIEGKRSSN